MKILLHCIYFPPEVGGLESHVHFLARALVERGHQVNVVTSRSLPGALAREDMGGIDVRRTWFPSRGPAGWIAHTLGSIPDVLALAKEADIIHAQAFPSVLPGVLGRSRSGAPLVATFHTSHFLTRAERPSWRPILGALVRAPNYALAASSEIARVAEALAPGVRVEALTNGVDTGFFRRVPPSLGPSGFGLSGRARIMVPRRLFAKNGVEFLVRALPLILDHLDVEAVLVGDGPERERLEALAGELGVRDRMKFLGRRPHDEMPGLLSSGDLAVVPSLMEATSVAALEAMACELPVVASRVGGLPEIVDESVGGLAEPGDPESLAAAIVGVLNAENRAEMGTRARNRVVSQWSNDRLADRHLEIYTELLHRRGRTS